MDRFVFGTFSTLSPVVCLERNKLNYQSQVYIKHPRNTQPLDAMRSHMRSQKTPNLTSLSSFLPTPSVFHYFRSMYSVWKSLLEGTMQVAQSRLNICENYKNLISEPARSVRCFKEQQLKKVFVL